MRQMIGGASIAISQQPDVLAYVSAQIGRGLALGAIYSRLPVATDAIDDLTLALARHVLQRDLPNIDRPPRDKWLQSAYAMIAADQPPLPAGYAAEVNVDRLIRWVDPKCESVLIGVIPPLDTAGVRGMRLVAEWMNRASQLPTIVVHGTEHLPHKRKSFNSTLEETLASRLEQDPELRGLFEPNVLVMTIFQTTPRVDFVWRKGRLIIEIDSYKYHSGRDRFTGDRQRDYETGASGYLTLRLTDQEIGTDLPLALQKIRRYVQLRKRLFHV